MLRRYSKHIIITALTLLLGAGTAGIIHIYNTNNTINDVQREQIETIIKETVPNNEYFAQKDNTYTTFTKDDVVEIVHKTLDTTVTTPNVNEEDLLILTNTVADDVMAKLEPKINSSVPTVVEPDYDAIYDKLRARIENYLKDNNDLKDVKILTEDDVVKLINDSIGKFVTNDDVSTTVTEIVNNYMDTKAQTLIQNSVLNDDKFITELSSKLGPVDVADLSLVQTNEGYVITCNSTEAVLYHGKDGLPGKDGADGKDGKDGAPGADGKDGAPGADGKDGKDGLPGKDGSNGKDGLPGKDGTDGKDGAAITNIEEVTSTKDYTTFRITYGNEDATVVYNLANGVDGEDGKDGEDGADGEDGYTPILGVDYYTENDISKVSDLVADRVTVTLSPLYGAELFNSRLSYAKGSSVVNEGTLYKANEDIEPGAFDASKWTAYNFTERLEEVDVCLGYVEYNPYATYKVGDTVYYKGELYRCITEIIIAESWDESKWVRTSLSDAVDTLSNANTELQTELDDYVEANDTDKAAMVQDIASLYVEQQDAATDLAALTILVGDNKTDLDAVNSSIASIQATLSQHSSTLAQIGINTTAIEDLNDLIQTDYLTKLEIENLIDSNVPSVDLSSVYSKSEIDLMLDEMQANIESSGSGNTTINNNIVSSIDLSAVDVLLDATQEPLTDVSSYTLEKSIDNYAMLMVAVKTNIKDDGTSDSVRTTLIPQAMYYPTISDNGKSFTLGTTTNYISWNFDADNPNTVILKEAVNAGLIAVYGIKSDDVQNVSITANNSETLNTNAKGRYSILPNKYSVQMTSSVATLSYDTTTHKLVANIDEVDAGKSGFAYLYTTNQILLSDYDKVTIDLEAFDLTENVGLFVQFTKADPNNRLANMWKEDFYFYTSDDSTKYVEVDIPDWNDKYYVLVGIAGRTAGEYSSANDSLSAKGTATFENVLLHRKDGRIHNLVTKDETLTGTKSLSSNNGVTWKFNDDYNYHVSITDNRTDYNTYNIKYTEDLINFDNIDEVTLDIAEMTIDGDFALTVAVTPLNITEGSTYTEMFANHVIWYGNENMENSSVTIDTRGIKGNQRLCVSFSSYTPGVGISNEPKGTASLELRDVYLTINKPVDTRIYNVVNQGLEKLGYIEVNTEIVNNIIYNLEWTVTDIEVAVDGSTYTISESQMQELLSEMKKYSDSNSDGIDDYNMWCYAGIDSKPANFEVNIWGNHTNTNLAEDQMANNVWWYYRDGMPWQYITTLKFNDEFVEPKDLIVIGLSTSQSQAIYKEETTLKSCDMSTARNTGIAWETNGGIAASLRLDNYYGDDLLAFNSVDDFVRWRDTGKPYKLCKAEYVSGSVNITRNTVTSKIPSVNTSTDSTTESIDLSNYYSKVEIDALLEEATLNGTAGITNTFGAATCDVLLDSDTSPITALGTYDLSESIMDYDCLIVGGWAYTSGGKYEQWISTVIPKEQYFVKPVGSDLQFYLNGSIGGTTRRICFGFNEDDTDTIEVTYKDGASITKVYGIKHTGYDFQKLNVKTLEGIGSMAVGDISKAAELIVVGSYDYPGSVPGYEGSHFSNGQTAKFSFSIPVPEIIDGSYFSFSDFFYGDYGAHLLFKYEEGKLYYLTNKSDGLDNIKILSVYATGSTNNAEVPGVTTGGYINLNPHLEFDGKLAAGGSIQLDTNFEDIEALIFETACDADVINYANDFVILNEEVLTEGVALTGFGKRCINLNFEGENTIKAVHASAETEADSRIPWVKSIYVIKKGESVDNTGANVNATDYYTKAEIDTLLGNASNVDLSSVYTKLEIDDKFNKMTSAFGSGLGDAVLAWSGELGKNESADLTCDLSAAQYIIFGYNSEYEMTTLNYASTYSTFLIENSYDKIYVCKDKDKELHVKLNDDNSITVVDSIGTNEPILTSVHVVNKDGSTEFAKTLCDTSSASEWYLNDSIHDYDKIVMNCRLDTQCWSLEIDPDALLKSGSKALVQYHSEFYATLAYDDSVMKFTKDGGTLDVTIDKIIGVNYNNGLTSNDTYSREEIDNLISSLALGNGNVTFMTIEEFNANTPTSGIVGILNGSRVVDWINCAAIERTDYLPNAASVTSEFVASDYVSGDYLQPTVGTSKLSTINCVKQDDGSILIPGASNGGKALYTDSIQDSVTLYSVVKTPSTGSNLRVMCASYDTSQNQAPMFIATGGKLHFSTFVTTEYGTELASEYHVLALHLDDNTNTAYFYIDGVLCADMSYVKRGSIYHFGYNRLTQSNEGCDVYLKYFAVVHGVSEEADIIANSQNLMSEFGITP